MIYKHLFFILISKQFFLAMPIRNVSDIQKEQLNMKDDIRRRKVLLNITGEIKIVRKQAETFRAIIAQQIGIMSNNIGVLVENEV